MVFLAACAPLRKPLEKRTSFSQMLQETEDLIRQEDWTQAIMSLEQALETWSRIKPILQIDIDHDYVNEIEDKFTLLEGYLETQDKSDSLANILLLRKNWEKIGEM
ncbi:MAG: DUF4363 family protein [Peptococcia bacterium]